MRRLGFALALALAALAAACGTGNAAQSQVAAQPQARLALTGRVVDNARALPQTKRKSLEQRLESLERRAGLQMAIVTVSDLKGRTIEAFGRVLGNGWGIGDKARDDGVLLIVAPHERKTRIEVGKGLESKLANALSQHVIDTDMIPHFKANEFEDGIEAGQDRIIGVLTLHPTRT
jgi:uncharacterized protein